MVTEDITLILYSEHGVPHLMGQLAIAEGLSLCLHRRVEVVLHHPSTGSSVNWCNWSCFPPCNVDSW